MRPSTAVGLAISNRRQLPRAGFDFAGLGQSDLLLRIGHFLDHGAHRIHVYLSGFWVELGAEIFFGLVILPRGDHHRVLDGRDDDCRFDVLLPADLLNHLVQQIRHACPLLQFHHQICLANRGKGHPIIRPCTSIFTCPSA